MTTTYQPALFDLPAGRSLRNAGIALVESHADRFVDTAREYARILCRLHGTVTSDDLQARLALPAGASPNTWGAIFHHSDFEPVGYVQSERPSAHARVIRTWRLKVVAS